MADSELHVLLDTESLNDTYIQNENKINRLLLYSKKPFRFERFIFNSDYDPIKKIEESTSEMNNIITKTADMINLNLLKKNLTEGEKSFLDLMIKHSSVQEKFKDTYIENGIFVTENRIFLEKYISIKSGNSELALGAFFPKLRLVSVSQGLEFLDIFAKNLGLYFGIRNEVDITPWYELHLFSKLTHSPVAYKNAIITPNVSDVLKAFIFRSFKVLLCIDYLARQHYFGSSRVGLIDPKESEEGLALLKQGMLDTKKLQGFVNLDDVLIIFYHIEYLISLVTGIFDNLAIETADRYNIVFPEKSKMSLSSSAGRDFLREVKIRNLALRSHIDANRDFINLVYEFREKVVHREGLGRKIAPIAAYWSTFIEVDHQMRNYIKNCGDRKSPYRHITEWGLVKKQDVGSYCLDPFYFAKNLAVKLIEFSDKYLELVKFSRFSDVIHESHEFIQDLKYFQDKSLRI